MYKENYFKYFPAILLSVILLISSGYTHAQIKNDEPLSKNSPTDKPHSIINDEHLKKYEILIEPYVKKAIETLPYAKNHFLSGLKKGEAFFLTTRIYDNEGNFEQIFVRVNEWIGKNIKGTIASDLNTVKGYKHGQLIEFPESAILDWTISKSNGEEEGNYVGKFLDTLN